MRRSRAHLLLACCLIAGTMSTVPAHALTECSIGGEAGTFEVRRIVMDGSKRGSNLHLEQDWPVVRITDDSNWHMFAGAWLLQPPRGNLHSYMFLEDGSQFGPSAAGVTIDDDERASSEVPATDVLGRGPRGQYLISTQIDPGTYYLVGFGAGHGTWSATMSIGGTDVSCEPVDTPGRILDFDASDFTGGTHVMAPGIGHGEGIHLSYENPHSFSVSALYAYQPPPLPPARVRLTTELNSHVFEQEMRELSSMSSSWNFTADYAGYPSDAPLIRVLQFDLPSS